MEFLRNLAIFYEPTFPGFRVICEARIIPWGALGNGKSHPCGHQVVQTADAGHVARRSLQLVLFISNTRSISASLRGPVRNSSVSSTPQSIISRSFQNTLS